MAISGADRVFAASLAVAAEYRTFSATEVDEITREMYGDNAPSRKTIYSHLDALAELGVVEMAGRSNTMKRYRFTEQFDPSR